MIGAQGALIAGMVARLKADAGLNGLIGGRVWDAPPVGGEVPHLLIGRCESRPLNAEGGAVEHRVTLTVASRFAGMEEARAVLAEAGRALETGPLEAGAARVVTLRIEASSVFRSADRRRAWGETRVRAVTDLGDE